MPRARTARRLPSRRSSSSTCQAPPSRRAPTQRGAGQDLGAARAGVERVEDDQPRIVDPAVGVLEGLAVLGLERPAFRIAAQVEGAGRRQQLAAAQMVVEEQAEPDEPGRAHLRHVRQHEAHRPDDVRRGAQQHLALDQRLAHQPELVVFEVAQAAMDQLAAARGGALGEVVLLAQEDLEAAAGGVAGDAGAVDAAADHERGRTSSTGSAALRPSSSSSCRLARVLVGGLGLGPRPVALEALLHVGDLGVASSTGPPMHKVR